MEELKYVRELIKKDLNKKIELNNEKYWRLKNLILDMDYETFVKVWWPKYKNWKLRNF